MLKNFDKFVGKAVTLFVVIAYFQFFKLVVIPYSFRIIAQMIAGGLMLALIILGSIYQSERDIKLNFKVAITVLIISSFPSFFVALSYHNQSLSGSLLANQIIWFYLLYFFVHVYKVPAKFLIRTLVIIGVLVVALFYVQYFLYPKVIMDIPFLKSRGTLRILVPGMLCTQLAYFFFLDRFFKSSRFLDLILSLVALSVFVLQGSRQLIFSMVFLTLIMLFFHKKVQSRFLKVGIIILASLAVFLIFRDIFIELARVSTSQVEEFGEGVRIKAARFYLTDFQSDGWTYLFGNSRPASGNFYGRKLELFAYKYGYYITDIGIIGDYVRYGIIFVIAGLFMLLKSIRFKVGLEYRYLKYYIVMQCFTLATGKGILGGVDILILLILYIFDLNVAQGIQKTETRELGVTKNK